MTYFKSLDSIRFFAASMVFVHHFEQMKAVYGYDSLWSNEVIRSLGEYGVSIFFVLSGFLITYLLLEEKRKNQRINIPSFYMRRLLRIWPLYFMIIGLWLLCYYLVPGLWTEQPTGSLGYYLAMLGNVASAIGLSIWLLAHLWSIGVEEQFYVIWPWLNKLSKSKLILTLLTIVVLLWGIRWYAYTVEMSTLLKFFEYSRFDMMAIGGLGAILFDRKKVELLGNKWIQVIIVGLIAFMWLTSVQLPYFVQLPFEAALYTAFIISMIKSSPQLLMAAKLRLLGRRTYGIYMYHPLIIALVLWGCKEWSVPSTVLFVVSFVLTILVSFLSYSYLEKPFLKIKNTHYHVE